MLLATCSSWCLLSCSALRRASLAARMACASFWVSCCRLQHTSHTGGFCPFHLSNLIRMHAPQLQVGEGTRGGGRRACLDMTLSVSNAHAGCINYLSTPPTLKQAFSSLPHPPLPHTPSPALDEHCLVRSDDGLHHLSLHKDLAIMHSDGGTLQGGRNRARTQGEDKR
jgi:hypothetical protein